MRNEIKIQLVAGGASKSERIPIKPAPIRLWEPGCPAVVITFVDGQGVAFTIEDAKRIGEALMKIAG